MTTRVDDGQQSGSAGGVTETSNHISGDAKGTVQVGVANTINYFRARTSVELLGRQVNQVELDELRKQFIAPANLEHAGRVLTGDNVVILLGAGAGRTFAGWWLLDGQACVRIVHLNPERSMGSVQESDLSRGDGYLWDLSERGAHPFKDWEIDRLRRLVSQTRDCRLVIVLNDRRQAPPTAAGLLVALAPPDAMALAEAAIDRDRDGEQSDRPDPRQILTEHFAETLAPGTSPERALLAAGLATRVAREELTVDEARQEFAQGFDREIANTIDDSWDTIEFTLMFAIALLQNEPLAEVIDEARDLDDSIRRKQLREGKKLRPRRAFAKPVDELVRTVRAHAHMRDNPLHTGLTVQTVQFVRKGWAEAVLCRIWQQYHVEHDLLLDWMCGLGMAERHFGASVWALSTLVSRVASGDRLWELNRLASRPSPSNWRLAAATLARLEDEHGFKLLVEQALTEWVEGPGIYRKCAAVVFYGYRFDKSDPQQALRTIGRIARVKSDTVRRTTVGTVVGLMTSPDWLAMVLPVVADWAEDRKSIQHKDGLHAVAREIGRYALGLTPKTRAVELGLDLAEISARYPDECRRLAGRIADDRADGTAMLLDMHELAVCYPLVTMDRTARRNVAELVRIARLLAPDLRWPQRRRAVARLCHRHPRLRRQIVRVFRTARRAERSGLYGDAAVQPLPRAVALSDAGGSP